MPKTSDSRPVDDLFEDTDGILVPRTGPVRHASDEYDPRGFSILLQMQREHFWYRGRHRFVRAAVEKRLRHEGLDPTALSALDLGGGCGGWVQFLSEHGPRFHELALADSSLDALRLARQAMPDQVRCYNASIYELPWDGRWDIVFLLDVIEHLADDVAALRQVTRVLKPGGLVIVTVPALMMFWSDVDEVGGHRRRYSCDDLQRLGRRAELDVLDTRYFMFILSPALWASRAGPGMATTHSPEQRRQLAEHSHRIPPRAVNEVLAALFAAETPAGLHVRFPWGTSALAVFRRPMA